MSTHDHVDPVSDYVRNFVLLTILLVVTVAVSYVDLPWKFLNITVAMAIASIKAVLVIWIFMGMRKTTKLTQVWAYAGLIFFLTLIVIGLSDYFSRPATGGERPVALLTQPHYHGEGQSRTAPLSEDAGH